MTVITLSRQMGSRGDDIATMVAERLGLRVVGRELLNQAARAAGAPEVALAEIDELGLLGVRPSRAAQALYREKLAEVIREQARAGQVLIVGRGAQVTLAEQAGVLHVRVVARVDQRVAVVQARCGISAEAAAARVAASDRARATFHKRYYGVNWEDPLLYDLVVNTGQTPVAAAAAAICAAALFPANWLAHPQGDAVA